ncbi:hypothetical protein FQN57_005371 [Myotisia sp. PD_48]|nr:hypothetical protein FQN57_005371 [Myotisia sp. PD_48]
MAEESDVQRKFLATPTSPCTQLLVYLLLGAAQTFAVVLYIQLLKVKVAGLEAQNSRESENAGKKKEEVTRKEKIFEEDREKDRKQEDGEKRERKKQIIRKKSRVRYLVSEINEYGDTCDKEVEFHAEEEKNEDANISIDRPIDVAISWRHSASRQNGSRELLIESQELRKALKEVIIGYHHISFDTEEVSFDAPYAELYHSREKLKEYAEKAEEDTKRDILILLTELENVQSKQWRDAKQLAENMTTQYDLLWTLFYPGCIVCCETLDDLQVSVVARVDFVNSDTDISCRVTTWSIDYDGSEWNYVENAVSIPHFKGINPIRRLKIFPFEYWKDYEGNMTLAEMEEKLIQRGRMFAELCHTKREKVLYEYEGPIMVSGKASGQVKMFSGTAPDIDAFSDITSIAEPYLPTEKEAPKQHGSKMQVIIDHFAYRVYGEAKLDIGEHRRISVCECDTCTTERTKHIGKLPNMKFMLLGREQLLLCPPRACGFAMREKIWIQMQVQGISDIQQDKEEAFMKLELPSKTKKLIKTLVVEHSKGDGYVDDLIPGKGAGLVVLLHGGPGVGKTLTAESLALLTGKPLYVVNNSDVGSNSVEVERNFRMIFKLATHWGALLLFDEADVFLEKRSLQDVHRNSLVSSLLRILEYFQGILFLTSNRVKTIDEAFQSRIHLAIYYKQLRNENCARVWRRWVKKYQENIDDYQQVVDETDEGGKLYSTELNGRQIRNVFSSAMALSQDDPDRKLKWSHLEQILDLTNTFRRYMNMDDETAQRYGLR